MRISQLVLAVVLATGALWATPASATSAVYLDELAQAELSTAVVIARVVQQEVDRHPVYGRPRLRSTLAVESSLRGDAPAEVVLNQLGGELDGQLLVIPGDARLEVGQRGVFFLRQVDGAWYLTAMEQSFYELVPSLDGDRLERHLGAELYVRDAQGRLVPRKPDADAPSSLIDLQAALRGAGVR